MQEDFKEQGQVIRLLQALNNDPGRRGIGRQTLCQRAFLVSVPCQDLAKDKIVPLMDKGEPGKIVRSFPAASSAPALVVAAMT